MKIRDYTLDFSRESLKKPFGFKGGYLDELWQIQCGITLEDGTTGLGKGVQSVLWADADIFLGHSQAGGNSWMFSVTEYALTLLRGRNYTDPQKLFHSIFEDCYHYAITITRDRELPVTFVLNALVAVDFALWQIWARQRGIMDFSAIAREFCPAMGERHRMLGAVPLISYNTSEQEIKALLEGGSFLLKIKIGSNPGNRNDQMEMCLQDAARVKQIHAIAAQYNTIYTDCGYPVYYLDANGRYASRDLMERFLEEISQCGALERVVLLEEPYPEKAEIPVGDLAVRVAGDESIHSASDAIRCIEELGYGAVALKPIAKTLSATLEIYSEAAARGIPCFCADLTVPPVMLEWNMQVAGRIGIVPGLKTGIVESNGAQNYQNWNALLEETGHPDAEWLHPTGGVYKMEDFYRNCIVL